MTTKRGARDIQTFIQHCSTIDACKPHLDDLLSQSPIGVNFAMRRTGTELIFDDNGANHHPSPWFDIAPCLFSETRKAVQNAEVFWPPKNKTSFKEYIFHGWSYTNKCKFEFSAEQWAIIKKLKTITDEYAVKESAIQRELCSTYNTPQTSVPLEKSLLDENNTTKKFTA